MCLSSVRYQLVIVKSAKVSYLVYREIDVVCGFQKGAADIKRLLNIRRSKADMQNETTRQIQKLVGCYFVVLSRLPIQSVNNTTSLNHNASLLRSLHHEYIILDRCLTNLFERILVIFNSAKYLFLSPNF